VAREAREMLAPSLPILPNPSPRACAGCAYRDPCIAANEGRAVEEIIDRRYRRRPPEQVEEGRLGGMSWSMRRGAAPPRFPPR
jgi:hypothetical protein